MHLIYEHNIDKDTGRDSRGLCSLQNDFGYAGSDNFDMINL